MDTCDNPPRSASRISKSLASANVVWHKPSVTRQRREKMNGHRSAILWFTGLSGAGKSTIAHATEEALCQLGCRTFVLDGDNVRHGLCGDLGFSAEDRSENIRRIGEMSKLFIAGGMITLTAFISPFRKDRDRVRALVEKGDFFEVYCRCPLEECARRDVKGLYKRALAGEIADFTGVSSPYEAPTNPELVLDTAASSIDECVEAVLAMLRDRGVIPPATLGCHLAGGR